VPKRDGESSDAFGLRSEGAHQGTRNSSRERGEDFQKGIEKERGKAAALGPWGFPSCCLDHQKNRGRSASESLE